MSGLLLRALLVWLVVIAAETVHGVLRLAEAMRREEGCSRASWW